MKAVVFRGIGDIALEDVPEPKLKQPTEAIIRITASAICGTDLHMIRGTMPGMKPGTILGHEAVGIVEEVGPQVRNLSRGDRVVVPSTIACGYCSYCRAGYHAQCDNANPNGSQAGTAFFGGPRESGPFDGLQAEYARIPFANVGLVKLPEEINDDRSILLSDIFPTGYFGAEIAEVSGGDTVAVFGCGPVGQFAILSAELLGAGRVFAVDRIPDRLEMARKQGAEVIDFSREDPVEIIRQQTGGIGADRVIDAVGVDATSPDGTPRPELATIAPEINPQGGNWQPGNAPSQALEWAVQAVCKAGTIGIIGVYPQAARTFPIGQAMMRNLTINMGNCNHRKYIPHLVDLVRSGTVDPVGILTQHSPLTDVISAYKQFDQRAPGWTKVELRPEARA
jgi:threonine dehydrogenase-like Zn-dependent dehydrogenase